MRTESRNNQQSYVDAFFNQLRITISILLIELSKLLVYFHFRSVKLRYVYVEETYMMLVAFFAFVKFVAASQHKR